MIKKRFTYTTHDFRSCHDSYFLILKILTYSDLAYVTKLYHVFLPSQMKMINETLGKDIIDLVMSQNLTMSTPSQIKIVK